MTPTDAMPAPQRNPAPTVSPIEADQQGSHAALALMLLLAARPSGARCSELARCTGLPVETTVQALVALQERQRVGYLGSGDARLWFTSGHLQALQS